METKELYDKITEKTPERWLPYHEERFQCALKAVKQSSEGIGVDVGGGDGRFAIKLNNYKKMINLDISKEALRRAGKDINLALTDVHELPFEKDSVSFIMCSEVIEHVENPEKLLAEIRRILNPDGVLFLTLPNGFGFLGIFRDRLFQRALNPVYTKMKQLPKGSITHINLFSFSRIKELIEKSGFEILDVRNADFACQIPTSLHLNFITKLDIKFAKFLPRKIANAWYFTCRVKK
ncbi:MAG: class I SAM-dependent methyltransferase [Candidatus Aenigmarchaeota archaeon]|nr:class I SAM-dependent methyltransferase [Candidatus Aenigmarchaeota archaeon]